MTPNTPSPKVCLFFQAHQPFRTLKYDFFQIGSDSEYFDQKRNQQILDRVCDRSYLPALDLFEELYEQSAGNFTVGLGLSGCLIKQLEAWRPDVLERFKAVVAKGVVHLTGGLMSHSIASFFSAQEVARQIQNHRKLLLEHFNVRPTTFANTELIYRDDMVPTIKSFGYDTILAEGVPRYLGHRSPDFLYHTEGDSEVNLLLRNGSLSDDLGFRFADHTWSEHPLTSQKFLSWIESQPFPLRNIFLDLETIGEHQLADSGIFEFWHHFIKEGLEQGVTFHSPDQIVGQLFAGEPYSSPKHSSWADEEKNKSTWQENVMQQEASQKLFRLQQIVESSNCPVLFENWTNLQSADHFLHMSTKGGATGEAHDRFRAHSDPYDAYSYFMNILADLQIRAKIKMAQHLLKDSAQLLNL